MTAGSGRSRRTLRPVYRPEDVRESGESLARPGQPPFTRGIRAAGYRERLWTMRQYAGYATAAESNRRYRRLLESGQTGLSVAFDLPTQIGYDSDHPLAAGEVGRVGVAIDSLEDMETLFRGISLDSVSTSMTINATAPILVALYVTAAERQGVAPERIAGTVQNDILKEYAARGTWIYPPEPSMRLATDLIEWCRRELPRFQPVSVSGYHMREAGCTAAQEVGFTLANGLAYVEWTVERGLSVDEVAARVSFFFNAHRDFLEEVAKFRAARRLWAKLLQDRFGSESPRARMLRFHTQTAGSTLTALEPQVNVVRTTLEALAAVLGGTQSLHTNALDEALGLPTEETADLALRTQQVIAFESGVAATVDPLGGSWAIEALTDQIEAEALEWIEQVDRLGGAVPAIRAGFVRARIQEAAYAYQQDVEAGDEVVVGVNRFRREEGGSRVEPFELDAETETAQVERVRALRARRDPAGVEGALAEVGRVASAGGNLMPAILSAVSALATVGEISDALRAVFGEHRGS
ncbi:MAG: methylmalonyl-CoA mutase family protein [Acidobacteria bacterium]|nr:methylmalonyl-CoA mutase family protein [Acidobacteriota bacterium]